MKVTVKTMQFKNYEYKKVAECKAVTQNNTKIITIRYGKDNKIAYFRSEEIYSIVAEEEEK